MVIGFFILSNLCTFVVCIWFTSMLMLNLCTFVVGLLLHLGYLYFGYHLTESININLVTLKMLVRFGLDMQAICFFCFFLIVLVHNRIN